MTDEADFNAKETRTLKSNQGRAAGAVPDDAPGETDKEYRPYGNCGDSSQSASSCNSAPVKPTVDLRKKDS